MFPAVLESLSLRPSRYNVDHYEYCFAGLAMGADVPDGTLVAYCGRPHRSLFSHPWRHILVVSRGRTAVEWLPEEAFQDFLACRRPPEHR